MIALLRGELVHHEDNRGIVVDVAGLGRVVHPWHRFDRLELIDVVHVTVLENRRVLAEGAPIAVDLLALAVPVAADDDEGTTMFVSVVRLAYNGRSSSGSDRVVGMSWVKHT